MLNQAIKSLLNRLRQSRVDEPIEEGDEVVILEEKHAETPEENPKKRESLYPKCSECGKLNSQCICGMESKPVVSPKIACDELFEVGRPIKEQRRRRSR